MSPQNENEQRESQIVRDALRHLPHVETAPDFEDRVLEAIRHTSTSASAQHVWITRTPTRREQVKLWFTQRALQIEKLLSVAPKTFALMCVLGVVLMLIVVLRTVFTSHGNLVQTPPTSVPIRERNAEVAPLWNPHDNSSR